jgi:hypothetical protein
VLNTLPWSSSSQNTFFQIGGLSLVLHHPILVSVPFFITQVGSTFFGSSFLSLASIFRFHQVSTSNPTSATYVIVADFEELSEDTHSNGALAYVV